MGLTNIVNKDYINLDKEKILFKYIEGDDNLYKIKDLIENENIKINTKSAKYNETLLQHSVRYYNYDIIKYLIENGADINVINDDGYNLLHLLAKCYYFKRYNKENIEKICSLIITDNNIEKTIKRYTYTPLDLAIYHRNAYLVKVLLNYNVNLNKFIILGNNFKYTFLDYLIQQFWWDNDELPELVLLVINHNNFDLKWYEKNSSVAQYNLLQYAGEKCYSIYKILKERIDKI